MYKFEYNHSPYSSEQCWKSSEIYSFGKYPVKFMVHDKETNVPSQKIHELFQSFFNELNNNWSGIKNYIQTTFRTKINDDRKFEHVIEECYLDFQTKSL